jgi:hypothetical protein
MIAGRYLQSMSVNCYENKEENAYSLIFKIELYGDIIGTSLI